MAKPKPAARPALHLIDCAKERRAEQQRETVAILSALLARAVRGEVSGLAMFFRAPDGKEHLVLTGPYRANLAEAVNAAARMSYRLAQRQDDAE